MGMRDQVARVKQRGASTSADRAIEQASMAAGPDPNADAMMEAQAQSIARSLLRGDAGMRLAFANEIAQVMNDPALVQKYSMALEIADRDSPGIRAEVLRDAADAMRGGQSPAAEPVAEAVAEPAQEAPPKPKRGFSVGSKSAVAANFPMHEQWKAYGQGIDSTDPVTGARTRAQGLQQLVENMNEHRSRAQRAAEGNQLMKEYTASPEAYQALRDRQVQRLSETPLSPEHVAGFPASIVSMLTGVPLESVTDSVRESLIGQKITPEQAIGLLDRRQRAAIAGPATFDQSSMSEADMSSLADILSEYSGLSGNSDAQAEDRRLNLSARDQVMAAIRADSHRIGQGKPGEINIDNLPMLRALRYPFYQSQGGVLSQPPLAPSGEFSASLMRTLLDPQLQDGSFMSIATPVLDDAIRRAAPVTPVSDIYQGKKGRTAMDFAKMKLPPYRGGAPLKEAEAKGLWEYPQFMEGVWMNRGTPKPPLDLGGLLIDSAAPAADATISTPEGASAPPAGPPVMPSEGDTSMYDPRRMDIAALAALLA